MKKILSILCITSAISLQLIGADISGDNVRATAGDVFISDNGYPAIKFVDNPSNSSGLDWTVYGLDNSFNICNGSIISQWAIKISHDLNARGSLEIDSSGDINLAGGSVFIDKSENKVGVGTSSPENAMHLVDKNVRLTLEETDTPSKMHIGLNGSYFYIYDPDESDAAFTIKKGSPKHSISISTNGVGIGTISPQNKLYVTDSIDENTELVELMALSIENTNASGYSDTGFMLENRKEDVRWTFRTLEEDSLIPGISNSFAISKKASGDKELIITGKDSEGGMTLVLANGAKCDRNGNWINQSTRSSKENITALSSEDAMAAFHKLEPMTYNYKGDTKESYVGFIAEDVPDLVAINSRDGLGAMDMVAVLTKVVQEQEKTMTETKAELKKAQEKIAKLEIMQKRLTRVESLLTNLALDTSNKTTEKVSLNK